ncbi:MAG: STAS domain-containing protein [Bacteroidales bacterium]|nr:STAS domain-containing protein [Bacteroidales bacterium]
MLKIAKEENKFIVSLFQVNKLNTLFSELISEQLNNLVSVSGRTVIFNLEGIRFIDTKGFQTLQKAKEIAQAKGSVFQLCNIGDEVHELFELTDSKEKFDIIPPLEVREKIIMELDD